MIEITYLDGAKQERVMHFDSYEEFVPTDLLDWCGGLLSSSKIDL